MTVFRRAPSTLLDLLLAEPAPGECTIAVLPPAAPGPAPAAPRPRKQRRPLQQLTAPLMLVARAVLRRPQVRQLALRILKRSPALYARAYRVMMASGSAAPAAQAKPQAGEIDGLSPRANAILRALRTLQDTPERELPARPRLAFVSPLPPQRTGVATYAIELLAELSHHFDIELVVAQPDVTVPASLGHLPVRQAAWFLEHGAQYDQVLYQFGNSPFHSHMFSLLARFPGVVVLHDFFLGGALLHAQMSGADPQAWGQALLQSHGYAAAFADTAASEAPGEGGQAHKRWPCSLPVLEGATRTIVHSRHARQLASDWFGPGAANRIDVIPHPRTPPPALERAAARLAARSALGIPEDCFLVCSFGFVAPNKLTHELLRAWIGSPLHGDPACMLVLAGANHDSPYGVEVEALIRRAGPGAKIRIAGWLDDAVYRQYLQAADAGVQLRTNAHGESSGAVLDCMNYGLPTIVNANGSMAEFPPDAVWRLPDAFEVGELSAALDTLRRDPARRQALGRGAVALLDAQCRPARCAALYLSTLERARDVTQALQADWRAALAQAAPAGEDDVRRLAATLADGETPVRRQLLVDVSAWVQAGRAPDAPGASQLIELLAQADAGLRVEPVVLDTTGAAPCLRQARNAAGRLLGLNWPAQAEPVVDVHAGDIFYAPDAAAPTVTKALETGLLASWRARGVTVNLGVRGPLEGAALRAAAAASRVICSSEAIAQQLIIAVDQN